MDLFDHLLQIWILCNFIFWGLIFFWDVLSLLKLLSFVITKYSEEWWLWSLHSRNISNLDHIEAFLKSFFFSDNICCGVKVTDTTKILETSMSTYRNKCWVLGAQNCIRQSSRRFGLERTRLMEASVAVCFDSAHPTYLETIFVLSCVAQIWVVPSCAEHVKTINGANLSCAAK